MSAEDYELSPEATEDLAAEGIELVDGTELTDGDFEGLHADTDIPDNSYQHGAFEILQADTGAAPKDTYQPLTKQCPNCGYIVTMDQ